MTVALLPWVRTTLKCLKPKESIPEPQTLGEHLKARRIALRLHRASVAQLLGVTPETVYYWERGRTEPPIPSIPAIVGFLGYDPFSSPTTLGDRLLQKRRERGWTITDAARQLGVDPGTWRDWEGGKTILFREHRIAIARLLGLDDRNLSEQMRAQWVALHRK